VGHCGVYRGFGWDESELWELSSNISPSCSGRGVTSCKRSQSASAVKPIKD